MKIIKLSQREDREAWLELRRGKVTATKAKGLKPLSRGADRTPIGFWELLAEKLAVAKDGESERDRGNRLEQENIKLVSKKYKIKLDDDPGFWISDVDKDIAASPDGAEPGNKPTYAVECKSFDSKNHLRILYKDRQAKENEAYRAFDSIPAENQDQVLQLFAVNENLKMVYWSLYDDRIAVEKLMHYVIEVSRESVAVEVSALLNTMILVINDVRAITKELINE